MPTGFDPDTLIPISGLATFDASISGYGSVSALVQVASANSSFLSLSATQYDTGSVSRSGAFNGNVPLNTRLNIYQAVSFHIMNDDMGYNSETQKAESNGYGASGIQAVVDPFVYIDPDWQYAADFAVYDAYSFEVSREWMNTVPIPGAAWLLGTGLIGFVGIRRKIKK